MTKPKPKLGRPPISPENKRITFTASISPQAEALFENWADGMREIKKCHRTGRCMDELIRHAARTNFNPSNIT